MICLHLHVSQTRNAGTPCLEQLMYLVARKSVLGFYGMDEKTIEGAVVCGYIDVPCIGIYRTMEITQPSKKRRTVTIEESRQQMLECLRMDGFKKVHITLASMGGPICKKMHMVTLGMDEIKGMLDRVMEEEILREKMLAFCMGMHGRLGKDSAVYSLAEEDLCRLVCSSLLQ
jgi:hypothetical protein